MIISKKNGFVFSRILKTGSTSAQAMFMSSGILGDDDIYSGYRNSEADPKVSGRNIPSEINEKKLREISPYRIPKKIYVKDATGPLLGHVTPTEMVRLGLITEEELKKLTVIATVRDPIDRYISAWFFLCELLQLPKTKEALIDNLKRKAELPNTFLGKTQRNHFEYEGELLKNIEVIDYVNLNDKLDEIISRYGGSIPEYQSLRSSYRPSWSKEPYINWMPAEVIDTLQDLMKDDVEFYNRYKTSL